MAVVAVDGILVELINQGFAAWQRNRASAVMDEHNLHSIAVVADNIRALAALQRPVREVYAVEAAALRTLLTRMQQLHRLIVAERRRTRQAANVDAVISDLVARIDELRRVRLKAHVANASAAREAEALETRNALLQLCSVIRGIADRVHGRGKHERAAGDADVGWWRKVWNWLRLALPLSTRT